MERGTTGSSCCKVLGGKGEGEHGERCRRTLCQLHPLVGLSRGLGGGVSGELGGERKDGQGESRAAGRGREWEGGGAYHANQSDVCTAFLEMQKLSVTVMCRLWWLTRSCCRHLLSLPPCRLAALLGGIASHHAGQLPGWKALVERLFQRGLLRLIFATGGLWGRGRTGVAYCRRLAPEPRGSRRKLCQRRL